MNWQDIKVSSDQTCFARDGQLLFGRKFEKVMKFHAPGLAPVKDETGSYHIDIEGNPLYSTRYDQTFGYYCNKAAVMKLGKWFHLTEKGFRAYEDDYAWTGNFQEDLCTVRNFDHKFFHIDSTGKRIYSESYLYCGDYKDGFACVRQPNRLFRHIDQNGRFVYNAEFIDLGVFHKGFATARDEKGWFHINREGLGIYGQRFKSLEPYYNGIALATKFDDSKILIEETGKLILEI